MREKKKITLILLSMVACVCIAFGLMQKQDVVQADGLSQIKYEKTYELGETLDVQAATITQGGQEYAAKAVVRYPSGVKYEKEKIVLSEAGVYTVEYTANANGKLISQSVSFTVKNVAYTIGGNGSVSYGTNAQVNENIKGLNVQLSATGTFRYNKVIDLSDNNVDSTPVLRFYTTPEQKGVREIDTVFVTLTDAYDPDNFVVVEYKGKLVTYVYVTARANNQPATGLQLLKTMKDGAVSYDNQIWSIWKNSGYYGAQMRAQFSDVTYFDLGFNNREKQVYFNGSAANYGEKLVVDLDEPAFFADNLFDGFTTGEVIMSIHAGGYASSNFNFFITQIDGQDLSTKTDKNATPPSIHVDFGDVAPSQTISHVVGREYTLFPAVAYDDSGNQIECKSYVYYNYYSSARTLVNVQDGCFTPTRTGVYTVVYKAVDNFGNQAVSTLDIRCISRETVVAEFVGKQTTGIVGQNVPIAKLDVKNPLSDGVVDVVAKLKNSDISYFVQDGGSFVPFYKGDYEIIYTYSDSLDTATFSYEMNVAGLDTPLFVGDAIVPKYFIKNSEYYIPDYYAYDYSNGTELKKADVYVSFDGGEKQKLSGNVLKVEGTVNTVDVIFQVGSEQKSYRGIVVDTNYGKRGQLDLSKYLYGGSAFTIETSTDGITYTTTANNGTSASLDLIQYGFLDVFNVQFLVQENADNFDSFTITLTSQTDRTDKICIVYESTAQGTNIDVQRGEYNVQGTCSSSIQGGQSFKLYVENETLRFRDSDLEILTSELFDGFSKKFFVNVAFGGITGDTAVQFKQMMNQMLSDITYDMVNPIFVGEEFAEDYKMGDTVYISAFDCYDFVDPNPEFYYTISDENMEFLTAEDGTVFDGEQNDTYSEYTILIDRYMRGDLLCFVKDYSGRKEEGGYTFSVNDEEPPTIQLETDTNVYEVGDEVQIVTPIVSDDNSQTSYSAGVIDPDGRIRIIKDNCFTADKAGTYTVIYYAFDETNNTSFAQYSIKVK